MTEHDSAPPPAELEERVVATLRARGLLGGTAAPRRTLAPRWTWPVAIAAGLLLFAGGFGLGRRPASAPAIGMSQYTLLLYEGPGFNAAGIGEPALVQEYSAWAGELAGRGQLVAGEKLSAEAWTLGAPVPAGVPAPTGYFVIAASTPDEALALARTCPHLKHGGTVAVRPVEPT